MLDIIDLDYDFPDRRLLQGVQFTVRPGALLHLRGGNGAGKTTLLKLLAGVLQPAHGDIRYRGDSINKDLAHYQQQICYVGHKTGVNQLLTVREHCRFELHRGRSEMSFNQLMMSCALVGLEEVSCGLLSEGLRRRVGLLRLLMSNASLWLLDEPLVALDKDAVAILMTVLHDHLGRGGAVVLTSHQTLALQQDDYQEYFL